MAFSKSELRLKVVIILHVGRRVARVLLCELFNANAIYLPSMSSTPRKGLSRNSNASTAASATQSTPLLSRRPSTLPFTTPATPVIRSNTRRSHTDENANAPTYHPQPPRDPFRTPLLARQPTQLSLGTPINLETSFIISDGITPTPTGKKRRVAQNLSQEEIQLLRDEHQAKQKECAERKEQADEESRRRQKRSRIDNAMTALKACGFPTFHDFLADVLTAEDPAQSSHISQVIINHGTDLLDLIRKRRRDIADDWIITGHRELLSAECKALASHFRPRHGASITEILSAFSIKGFLSQAERVAPLVCDVLRQIGFPENASNSKYKDRQLVSSIIACFIYFC
jgi:uncharacterized protein YdaT